jgi:hypothetical protein
MRRSTPGVWHSIPLLEAQLRRAELAGSSIPPRIVVYGELKEAHPR